MTKTTRSRSSQQSTRVTDSVPEAVRKVFAAYCRSELLSLRERNVNMLRRRELMSTLPDKGAKLQERIRQIDLLLQDEGLPDLEIKPENTFRDHECALTRGFTSLSLHAPQQLTKRRIVATENARVRANSISSSSLSRRASLCRDGLAITTLQRRMSSSCSISSSSSSSRSFTETSLVHDNQPKVCMMTIDESIKLQEERHKAIEQYREQYRSNHKRQTMGGTMADTLSATMDRMSLDPQPEALPPPPPLIAELQSEEDDMGDEPNSSSFASQGRIPYESIPFEGYSLDEEWSYHGHR